MDSLNLAIFLEKEATNNPQINRLREIAIEKIEENQQLRKQLSDSKKTLQHLKMDVFTLERIQEKFRESAAIRKNNYEAARNAFLSTLQTRLQFENLHLQKVNQCEILKIQMKMKEELAEVEQNTQEKREMYDEMNKREIVQQLRFKQEELRALQEEIKSTSHAFEIDERDLKKQIENAMTQRNTVVVELINCLKNVHQVQKELKTEGNLTSNNMLIDKKSKQMQLTSFDSSESFNVFKKLQCEVAKFPTLLEEMFKISSNKQMLEKHDKPIKSILRYNKTKNEVEDSLGLTPTPKRVLLVTTDNTSNSANNSDDDDNSTISVETTKQQPLIIDAHQESEVVIENDEQNEENMLLAQIAPITIDLITPSVETNNIRKNGGLEVKGSEEVQNINKGDSSEFENNLNDSMDSVLEMPSTSSKAKERALNKLVSAKQNDEIQAGNEVTESQETVNDIVFQFESVEQNMGIVVENAISNPQVFADFINFSMNFGGDDQNNEINISPNNDSFSKFFD